MNYFLNSGMIFQSLGWALTVGLELNHISLNSGCLVRAFLAIIIWHVSLSLLQESAFLHMASEMLSTSSWYPSLLKILHLILKIHFLNFSASLWAPERLTLMSCVVSSWVWPVRITGGWDKKISWVFQTLLLFGHLLAVVALYYQMWL